MKRQQTKQEKREIAAKKRKIKAGKGATLAGQIKRTRIQKLDI